MAAFEVRREGSVSIWSVLGSGDERRIEDLLQMYARLFPQYAHYVPRMRRRAAFGAERRAGHVVHYWLVEVDGRPAGLRTFRYVHSRHAGLAHALAIAPDYREVTVDGQRLSMYLARACLEQVQADALERGGAPVTGMVNEVDSPRLMEHYRKHGILELPARYVEPIFPAEQDGRSRAEELSLVRFAPMTLGFLPGPGQPPAALSSEVVADFAQAFLIDHYGLPAAHPRVQAVLDSIPVLSSGLNMP
jgi:hypothetical protein